MSTIILTHQKWDKLKERIDADYGRTMIMLGFKLKRELGFTVRKYQDFQKQTYFNDIRLDFYDGHLETLFRLKYCEYL